MWLRTPWHVPQHGAQSPPPERGSNAGEGGRDETLCLLLGVSVLLSEKSLSTLSYSWTRPRACGPLIPCLGRPLAGITRDVLKMFVAALFIVENGSDLNAPPEEKGSAN